MTDQDAIRPAEPGTPPAYLRVHGDDLLLRIKAVPGASRDAISGALGDRLKVRVSAAPEGGRANQAICTLIAASLGIRARLVSVEIGATSPEKVLRLAGQAGRIELLESDLIP